MQYLLMIYQNEAEYGQMDAAAGQKMLAEYGAFTSPLSRTAISRPATGCSRYRTATTVRVRDGKTLTTDGPFAETREQLGGYYLVEAKDLDAALAIAARIPGARFDRSRSGRSGFIIDGDSRHSGMVRRTRPGISRFRVRRLAPPGMTVVV